MNHEQPRILIHRFIVMGDTIYWLPCTFCRLETSTMYGTCKTFIVAKFVNPQYKIKYELFKIVMLIHKPIIMNAMQVCKNATL